MRHVESTSDTFPGSTFAFEAMLESQSSDDALDDVEDPIGSDSPANGHPQEPGSDRFLELREVLIPTRLPHRAAAFSVSE